MLLTENQNIFVLRVLLFAINSTHVGANSILYMGKYRRVLMASIVGLTLQKLKAQEHYAVLEKNVNVRAKELSHELNKTKDTLLLKSDKKIDYVYAINSTYHREVDTYVFENSFKVPLNKLSVGKHLFVVGQNHMKIIFVVRIVEELSKIALVTDKKVITIEN